MSRGPVTRPELRRAIGRGNLLHGAHLAAAANFVLWRVLETTPALASAGGATWTSSAPGRAWVFVSVIVGVAALALIAVATFRPPLGARACALFAALVLALAWRARVDVFDLVYVGLTLVLATHWYRTERPELRERVLAT